MTDATFETFFGRMLTEAGGAAAEDQPPVTDAILRAFLERQYELARQLEADSDILELHPVDAAPHQRYMARFKAKGLAQNEQGEIVEVMGCDAMIWMPDDYLRRVVLGQVLSYIGPHSRPFHPNIQGGAICVHLPPALALVEVLYTMYDLWTWHLKNTADEGLNHPAAQWARAQDPSRFPID
ncbi:hypothetical protein LCGC14_1745750, partial [marine sediment metagenome]